MRRQSTAYQEYRYHLNRVAQLKAGNSTPIFLGPPLIVSHGRSLVSFRQHPSHIGSSIHVRRVGGRRRVVQRPPRHLPVSSQLFARRALRQSFPY